MYIPSAHRLEDPSLIAQLMRENAFATLVSVVDDMPVATHLPILVDSEAPIVLCGHLARQNKQWKALESARETLVIFSGPHGYVSPMFYQSEPNVPTWNYVSIHAYGTVQLIEDEGAAISHLQKIVTTFDPSLAVRQPESTAEIFYRRLLPGIVAFRLTTHRVEAKAKLNQNKSEIDRAAVRDRYLRSDVPDELRMGQMMS